MRIIEPVPDDPLVAYRLHVMYPVSVIGAVINLPFAIVNFVNGRHAPGHLRLVLVLSGRALVL